MIDRPLIIIGAPRSGTTILQRCLAMHPDLWHLRAESHDVLEGPLHPDKTGRDSNRCVASDVLPEVAEAVRQGFYRRALNVNQILSDPAWLFSGRSFWRRIANAVSIKALGQLSKVFKPNRIRLLEKTPKNTLRVPFLERLFPDALYIWNRRRPEKNIDSLIAGWKSERRIGPFRLRRFARSGYAAAQHLQLRDYTSKWWKFAWVPGWRSLERKTVADVAAWQYYQCNRFALEDLGDIDDRRIMVMQHERFVREPREQVSRILQRARLPLSAGVDKFAKALPRVNSTGRKGRSSGDGLRYPKQVERAMKDLPELAALRKNLGY